MLHFPFPPDHLVIFLKDVDSSAGSKKRLMDIETVCETDLQGSTTLRDIHILVCNSLKFNQTIIRNVC